MRHSDQWARIPFDPARVPFFYGWVIVAATAIGMIASIPGQTVGVGVFTDSLIEALGLSRNDLTLAYMFGTLASSFILPYAGSLVDRLGARIMVVISSIGLSISLMIMSQTVWIPRLVGSPWLIITLMAVCFLLIRFFGQGCLTMVSRVTLGKWFDRRRGLATGISNVFVSFAFNVSPAVLNQVVKGVGWRASYLYMALAVGMGMAALGWIFFRDNPEQCGLTMDGRAAEPGPDNKGDKVPATIRQYTRGEALRTLPFWIYSAALGWQALFMTAVPFHMSSIGAEAGLDREGAFGVFAYIGFFGIFVAIVASIISDHVRLKYLLLTTIVCQAVAAFGMMQIGSPLGVGLFVGGYGISAGLFGLMLTIVWPRYYGREHLGSISGVTMSVLVCASAIGPFSFTRLHDWVGGYRMVMLAACLIPLSLLAPALMVRNPQGEVLRTC